MASAMKSEPLSDFNIKGGTVLYDTTAARR